ncbi:MAG: GrpB family protein [Chloroflexi bacterium]|nr:MAG: GrpB family protein [Chloroflexota bacterium]
MTTRMVVLVPHNPAWRIAYEAEAASITAVFRPILHAIHHIGSTAVASIMAKPIIDILVEVTDIGAVDEYNQAMTTLGYIAKGENGIPGRRYFRKGSDTYHTHHIHIFQVGHPEIARHLDFRDYLITHPETAQAYNDLKVRLAHQFRDSPPDYTNAKGDFIEAVIRQAAVWRMNQ